MIQRLRGVIWSWLAGLLFVLALASIGLGLRRPEWQIQDIQVLGARHVEPVAIRQAVESTLSGGWLWPRSNLLLYPRTKVKEAADAVSPRLAAVDSRIDWGNRRLLIEVAEHEPVARWCQFGADGRCLWLSASGQAFALAPRFSGRPFVDWRTVNRSPALGDFVVPSHEWRRWRDLQLSLDKFFRHLQGDSMVNQVLASWAGQRITAVAMFPDGKFEFVVGDPRQWGPDWRLIIAAERDLSAAWQEWRAAVTDPQFIETWRTADSPLEYFDLRFPSKVFYRFADPS